MKQLVILSGKGGAGKTTVCAALAHLMAASERLVIVDADVDAPNLGLILGPQVLEEHPFHGGKKAVIEAERCTACGRCAEICRFDAVQQDGDLYSVDPLGCEGCAACAYGCPAEAIHMQECLSGAWFRSESRFGPLVHAQLRPGEENSGKLVSTVRQQALILADDLSADWILVDGSPGIGCPVIAAVAGSDLALLVIEPTVSGVHDFGRVLGVTQHFKVPAAVCINKADLNPGLTQEILSLAEQAGLPVLAQIPYDDIVIDAMRQARAVTELPEGAVASSLRALWVALRNLERPAKAGDRVR
jgi:MinD superfamily P-loop ATPase